MEEAGKKTIYLHELNEIKNEAYESSRIYKTKMKAFQDKNLRIRELYVHHIFWFDNSQLKLFSR